MNSFKKQALHKRFGFALAGILAGWREPNFRIQVALGMGAIAIFAYFEASAGWWAILALTTGGVLSAELFNTALEHLLDHLHPERHPSIALAKDCAAGAVLMLSLASLGVLLAFLATLMKAEGLE